MKEQSKPMKICGCKHSCSCRLSDGSLPDMQVEDYTKDTVVACSKCNIFN